MRDMLLFIIASHNLTIYYTMTLSSEDLRSALTTSTITFEDEDMLEYLINILLALENTNMEEIRETVQPFIESYDDYNDDVLDVICGSLSRLIIIDDDGSGNRNGSRSGSDDAGVQALKKLDKLVSMQDQLMKSDADGVLVGDVKLKVQANANTFKDAFSSAESSKDRRKAKQELEKARKEYEASLLQLEEEEERLASSGKVAEMILPDYSSGRNDRDIQCSNISLALDNGRSLLDDTELKFSYGRRYGLVGKNGIGKTTLLKAIAAFEIPGFPRHHRVLHVRQEIRGSEASVLDTVLAADVERNGLLQEERDIVARLEGETNQNSSVATSTEKIAQLKDNLNNDKEFEADLKRLDEIYGRLAVIGADNATTRAATILSGLQFSNEMQRGPTSVSYLKKIRSKEALVFL